ncbi:hypothetical protein [Parasitella parasitica]|uniref:Uncharacterized protein n=1 Tax=Parasitella parasitica TaxID=35722 RepID=A0A0B7NML0_9FUNG|nr:hypothetical protein [Parasitella parasitica]
MFCSLLITITYIHFRISRPDEANRVSLRCVFMASLMNLINSIFDIAIVLIVGDTYACRASAMISMLTRVMSAVFLTLVGVNLVLVFVCNVNASARRLERIYYPSAFAYGLLTITMPIVESSDDVLSPNTDLRCYYYIHYYQFLGHSSMLWMWFYGFLFLSVVIAVICSIIALIKLMREHRALIRKWIHIASMSQTTESAQSNIEQRAKSQSNVFMRVVSRCVMYPLVPFISNIWGRIRQYSDGQMEIVSLGNKKSSHTKGPKSQSSSITIVSSSCLRQPPSIYNKHQIAQQMSTTDGSEELSSNVDSEINTLKQTNNDAIPFNTVPMRRLSVPPSVYTRIHHTDNCISPSSLPLPQSSVSSSNSTEVDFDSPSQSCFANPHSDHRILVPYKHPRLAFALHWFLVKCGFGESNVLDSSSVSRSFQPR